MRFSPLSFIAGRKKDLKDRDRLEDRRKWGDNIKMGRKGIGLHGVE
jgi:hypothetical protein